MVLGTVAAATFAAAKERTIKIVAKKFEFVPPVLHVKLGEPVLLELTAPEVPMGFNLADFHVRADVIPGKTATLRFTPDRAGTFTFVCDVFCGSGHEDMSGTLIVA
jgi:cytochrome c oxidase subunit II